MPKSATLAEVAKAAGVAKSTAQRVLSGRGSVSPSSRKVVEESARALNYSPDPALQRLAKRRWKRDAAFSTTEPLAWIAPQASEAGQFDIQCLIHARQCASLMGYDIHPFLLKEYSNPKDLCRILWARGIRGILLSSFQDPGSYFEHFPWDKFSAVAATEGKWQPPVPTIARNNFENSLLAWEALWNRGYRRIGMILLDQGSSHRNLQFEGGFLVIQQESLSGDSAPLPPLKCQESMLSRQVADYLRTHRPEAMLAANPFLARECMRIGRELGSPCPAATLKWQCAELDDDLAGVDVHLQNAMAAAVNCLHSRILNAQTGTEAVRQVLEVECSWRDGPSVPVPPTRASRKCSAARTSN